MTSGEGALLRELEGRLAAVANELPGLRAGMRPYLQGGKRIRSKLLFTIGSAGPAPNPESLVRYATFVELVHAGGLCHDDIVDRSDTRRGRPSIGALYGIPAATHAGLFLMAHAFESVAGDDSNIRSWVAEAARRVARGQAREMCDLYREDVSVEEYLERSSDKTGALFELTARLGALGGGFGEIEQDVLSQYGAAVGLAFQLADDVRDIIGGATLGRERGTDVREGVYTLPVLFILSQRLYAAEPLRVAMRFARERRDQAAVDQCCEIVKANGGVSATTGIMRGYIERAVMLAHRMPKPLARLLSTAAIRVTHGVGGTP